MLTPQTPAPPNAVLINSVNLNTRIVAGKLKTSATIVLQAAVATQLGTASESWAAVGPVRTLSLPDLANLAADLAPVAAQVAAAEAALETAVAAANAIRKLV